MHTISQRLLFAALGFLLVAEGCQVYNAGADFVTQRYVNTVSYFNTYYNAERAFGDAEKEVLAGKRAQQWKPALPGKTNSVSQGARAKFNTAIEKASRLLSYYPTCKWVDDALLMIGKSYFYLEDDIKAERKFLELFAKYPDSDLRLEAELWYGRSLLRQKRYDEGVQLLENLYTKAVTNKENEIAALASISAGMHFFGRQEWVRAEKYFQQSLAISSDDKLNAETQLEIGYCYRGMNDLPKASQAFVAVDEFDPDYTTSFTAKLENIKIMSESHKYDEALSRLNTFLDDGKNAENFSKIHLAIGNIYLAQNRIDDAIAKFSYLDTAFARTEEAAKAYFELGKIYERLQGNYLLARANYDKARMEFPASDVTAEAAQKADAFSKYFALRSDLKKYDSLIVDLRGRKGKRDSLNFSAVQQADTAALAEILNAKSTEAPRESQKRLQANRDSLVRLDSLKVAREKSLEISEQRNVDSLRQMIVKAHFELGGIFYLEINEPDSALGWFQKVIDESGNSNLAPRALFTVTEIYGTSKGKGKSFLDSLYRTIIARYPESPYAQESRRALGIPLISTQTDPADSLYARAESYMEGASPDSALRLLYRIVKENATSPFSAKALYAIGWLYENKLDRRDSASVVYRRLIAAYPESRFAGAVRPKVEEEDNAKKEAELKAKEELEAKKKKEEEQKKSEKESGEAKPQPPVNKEKP
jgi:TolA-binding protein